MTESSTLALNSDTDSDAEPNTTDANVFWGSLKTPEKLRINNDPPQTILRSTLRTQSYESSSKSTHENSQDSEIVHGRIESPQTAVAGPSIQTEDRDPDPASVSSMNPIVENAGAASMESLNHQSLMPTLQNNPQNNNDSEQDTLTNSHIPTSPPSDRSGVLNTHTVQLETQLLATPPIVVPTQSTDLPPHPSSVPCPVNALSDKTPTKPANDLFRHLVTPSTPQTSDNSARKERRMRLKHNEDRARLPLLSLSPASSSVLNLVQSPVRQFESQLTIPSTPTRKAQRILIPASSLSPAKPRLLRLPSPVKLDDPNRIPARRIPNLHSPLRMIQNNKNHTLIYSPARRVPIVNSNNNVVGSVAPNVSRQTADIFPPTPSVPANLPSGHPHDVVQTNGLGNPAKSTPTRPITSPWKTVDLIRGSNAAKAGPSKLPIPSSRSVSKQPSSSLLSVRKRFDPASAATMPSQIPSPVKQKPRDNAFTFVSQTTGLPQGSKRKRAENESEDESDERPPKRTDTGIQSPFKKAESPSRLELSRVASGTFQKALEPTDDPFESVNDIMDIDKAAVLCSITESTPETENTALPANSSTSTPYPRRTPRVRKLTPKDRKQLLTQTIVQSLPSRQDSTPKSHSKPSSRPPSRAAIRVESLESYPDNPRQLQWLTSVNTQRNQEYFVELEHQVIRKHGNRPPSPSSRFRIDANKGREEREARAERRQRRDRSNDAVALDNVTQNVETVVPSLELTGQNKHMRAAGDDDDYETPVKDPKPSQLHPDRTAKMVKWNKDLIVETSTSSGTNSSEQSIRPKVKFKSCFLQEPTTLALNFLGNMPNADEPLPDLVKEHIVVSRFIYDDDIQESQSPRRSKKKLV